MGTDRHRRHRTGTDGDDGFLAVGVEYPAQPLPDQLPPEVAALFPPEVTALFPDGLPPTLEEATEILREAGLFDVVMNILNEHPEAMDAVQSAPRPEQELLASWSADGDSWIPVEVAAPGAIGDVSQLAVSGDRLTVAGTMPPGEDGGPWIVTVASTTDLENWITASFPLTQPEGLPETEQIWVFPIAVAADDEHWVVRIMVGSDGFLDLGERVTFSPDGQTWTEVPEPAPNVIFQGAAPLGDGVLAIGGEDEPDRAHRGVADQRGCRARRSSTRVEEDLTRVLEEEPETASPSEPRCVPSRPDSCRFWPRTTWRFSRHCSIGRRTGSTLQRRRTPARSISMPCPRRRRTSPRTGVAKCIRHGGRSGRRPVRHQQHRRLRNGHRRTRGHLPQRPARSLTRSRPWVMCD